MPAQTAAAAAKSLISQRNSSGSVHVTSRGDHTLNVRMLWFRGRIEREEPAMLALDLLSRERLDDALDVVMTALETSPRDPELVLVAGRVHLARGETERARDRFIAAARLEKTWAEPFAWLARLLSGEGRRDKAAEVAERAVLLGSDDDDIRILDQPRRAQRLLGARVKAYLTQPDRDDAALLVLSLESAGRIEEALTVLDRALALEPDDEDLDAIRARLRGVDPNATSIDVRAEDCEEDEEAREEAFFRSLGIATKSPVKMDEPSVIVSDTLLGEPAPRFHKGEVEAKKESTDAFPLVQVAKVRARGWLPKVGLRKDAGPQVPPTTVRVAPMANVARRDPTIRFWLGR